jgi:hypothetical protein
MPQKSPDEDIVLFRQAGYIIHGSVWSNIFYYSSASVRQSFGVVPRYTEDRVLDIADLPALLEVSLHIDVSCHRTGF